ncbi:conserved hypothetical protein [Aspergillus terreus NIH2624]|uniref:Uncharacterized protein n=1 Tax=Aspergillus terreus (strain NIH 2624 / FGSC A1156) TaxID=341663 RepID=Q0CS38_ASPTN|nr:uncharacterized protein ATEG_03496 [Aspergillus terreus NIH2624]EAU36770.1 conserved hypothetical protein [Aspergillus terreus NIH2624]
MSGVNEAIVDDKAPASSETINSNMDCKSRSMELTHSNYTVGWVCALSKEQTAATAMLDRIHPDLPKPPNDHNTYTLGSIERDNIIHNIVIACLPKGKYGTNSAATVVTRMVSTFPSIKFGIMVGIGGGIPPKVRLGDVVVSSPVDQYPGVVQWDIGKAEEGGTFKRTGALNNPPSALLTALAKLETQHEMHGSKIRDHLDDLGKKYPNLASKYTWSESLKDPLFTPDIPHHPRSRWHAIVSIILENILALVGCVIGWWVFAPIDRGAEQITSTQTRSRHGNTRVHYGLIASGNQVVKDAGFRDSLNESLGGNVLCVEMEAAGVMNDFPCLVIRGICDYADSRKNDRWQEYAAAVAAAEGRPSRGLAIPETVCGIFVNLLTKYIVLDTMQRTDTNVGTIRSKLNREEDLEVLNWLTSVDYGPQHSDFLKRRQPGTGKWFLDSAEYQTWLSSSNQTLFCPGIPGAGKTILTAIVIDDLTVRFPLDQSFGIAYIYCNFRRQNEQKVEDLLASLLKQLSQGQPSLPESVGSLYDRHKNKRTRPSFDEISNALRAVAGIYSRVFILVDALDECQVSDDCRTKFLTEIFHVQATCGANIYATSRFIPQIWERFNGSITLEVRASDQDVQQYLKARIVQSESKLLASISEEIQTGITKAVDGMFLLAQLHFDSVKAKKTVKRILETIKSLSKGSEAYNHAYKDAMQRIEGQDRDSRQLAMDVLSWIVCAKSRLNTSQLQHALAVEAGEPELDKYNLPQVEDMVSVCAGLVTVDEESGIIRLVHYTTQEYFQQTQTHWFPDAEANITRICVSYLSFRSFEGGPCQSLFEYEWRLRLNKLYYYSATNWGHHARGALTLCPEAITFLRCTLKVEASSQALMGGEVYWPFSARTHMTGLHLAAYFGIEEAVKARLQETLEINANKTDDQAPPGDDLESKDFYGRTPLSWAAGEGHGAVVKYLVEKGADLESKDEDYGRTPLSWAAEEGHGAVVKYLVEHGADLESKDEYYGRTPLSWAVENGHKAVVKYLVEKGADLESKDHCGRTPLLSAAEHSHEAVFKCLVEKGADLELKDNNCQTLLFLAAEKGHEAVVKYLVEHGADLESKDEDYGRTPLSWAAEEGHGAVVKYLVEHGADLESKDKYYGRTPLLWAVENGHKAVVKYLVEKGACLDLNDNDEADAVVIGSRQRA